VFVHKWSLLHSIVDDCSLAHDVLMRDGSVRFNDIGDDGALAFAEALKTNTTLTTLCLE
jgi:hypothetical protein